MRGSRPSEVGGTMLRRTPRQERDPPRTRRWCPGLVRSFPQSNGSRVHRAGSRVPPTPQPAGDRWRGSWLFPITARGVIGAGLFNLRGGARKSPRRVHSNDHPFRGLRRDAVLPTAGLRRPRAFTRKAQTSACSSMRIDVGFPNPWPAFVWIRISTGAPAWAAWRVAANLNECPGTTRSSWSAVVMSVAGYRVADLTLWRGEYVYSVRNCFGSSGDP